MRSSFNLLLLGGDQSNSRHSHDHFDAHPIGNRQEFNQRNMRDHGHTPEYPATSGSVECILLEPYHAVYIEIPKVACTSLKVAFAQLLGISLEDSGGNPHQARYPAPLVPPSRSGPLYPALFSFAFVRNPWDRLVSCYRDKIRGEVDGFTDFTLRPGVADCLAGFDDFVPDMSFDDFVEVVASIRDEDADAHFRSQYTFLTNDVGQLGVDFIGRYERLQADFNLIQQRIGLQPIKLPHLQAARYTARYVDYYSPTTRSLVAKRFVHDIELFQYKFNA